MDSSLKGNQCTTRIPVVLINTSMDYGQIITVNSQTKKQQKDIQGVIVPKHGSGMSHGNTINFLKPKTMKSFYTRKSKLGWHAKKYIEKGYTWIASSMLTGANGDLVKMTFSK